MPPKKRNRDDEGLTGLNQGASKDAGADPLQVKTEKESSQAQTARQNPPEACEDKEELKAWLKDVLRENAELKTKIESFEKAEEKAQDERKTCSVADIVARLYRACFPVTTLISEQVFFYRNPYVVEFVEKHWTEQEVKDTPRLISSSNEDWINIKEVSCFSEIVSAFKETTLENGGVGKHYSSSFGELPRFYLNLALCGEETIVVGATGPYSHKFVEEINSWQVMSEMKEVYGDVFARMTR